MLQFLQYRYGEARYRDYKLVINDLLRLVKKLSNTVLLKDTEFKYVCSDIKVYCSSDSGGQFSPSCAKYGMETICSSLNQMEHELGEYLSMLCETWISFNTFIERVILRADQFAESMLYIVDKLLYVRKKIMVCKQNCFLVEDKLQEIRQATDNVFISCGLKVEGEPDANGIVSYYDGDYADYYDNDENFYYGEDDDQYDEANDGSYDESDFSSSSSSSDDDDDDDDDDFHGINPHHYHCYEPGYLYAGGDNANDDDVYYI